ncbi:MAG: flagellar hook assembly protein FlgD [Pseudomonadota bacterium]
MNAIESNEFLSSLNTSPTTETKPRDELGQEEFLELMIAQFQNQDPFEPMTNGDFLAQLAQFSTVSGISDLQGSFDSLANAISGEQALQAGSLIGKDVLTQSEFATHSEALPLAGVIDLEGAAQNVAIDLIAPNGELVRTLSLGEQSGGPVEFEWDGLDNDGESAADGTYQLVVRVQRGDFVETVPALIRSEVESVSFGDNRGVLVNTSNSGSLLFSQIDRIL